MAFGVGEKGKRENVIRIGGDGGERWTFDLLSRQNHEIDIKRKGTEKKGG